MCFAPLRRPRRAVPTSRVPVRRGRYLVSIRKSGKSLRRYRREEEGVATPGKFTLTVARHSTLPSEGVTGWGYDLGKLLRQSSFEAAASCGSFFPVPPEGFTTGCHLPEASMKESLYRLIFRQQTEVLLRNAEQTKKTVGSVLEESNGERCTVVEVMESKHSWQQKVKVRFEGSDEVVERQCHQLDVLLPLQVHDAKNCCLPRRPQPDRPRRHRMRSAS